jgi:TolB-like protein/DNA-binding winged helix-turn-helix (wHTH) protein/Tfp pilus assembly protein PilF
MGRSFSHKFGVFEVNLHAHELRKHGVRVRLSGQPFAILEILLESPGEIVTREQMRAKLWNTDTFVDFEHSLNSAIKKLRAALGDSPDNSRYVETIPKLGYRFIAPVEELAKDAPRSPTTEAPGNSSQSAAEGVGARAQIWLWVLGACLVAIAALAISWRSIRSAVPPRVKQGRVMIAVLPFKNLTGDSAQDYFSDGLTEEMIAQLRRLNPDRLGVIASSSVVRFQRQGAGLDKIQKELGVEYVVEGTVRRDAGRVRVTTQLVQSKDQSTVWSREYDRSLGNLLVLQGEIAQQLSGELLSTFEPRKHLATPATLSPESFQAYDLYLKGRYFWNKRTPQGFGRALECFQQSIAKDPAYARSYAGLADTYALMGSYYIVPVDSIKLKAREAARRATQLDDNLAEGHTSLAVIAQNVDWDWQTAEKEYRRAIELDPNYATAHHWYAEELSLVGRFDEALTEIERARQLDPMSLIIAADRGVILYYARRNDQAIEQLKAVLDMEPSFGRARMLENAYVQKQMFAEAFADSKNWERAGDNVWRVATRGYLYGKTNQRAQALECLRQLQKQFPDHAALALLSSFPYLGLNDKEKALQCLERSLANHSISTAIAVEPFYDPLREEPRFQAILAKMNFPANANSSLPAKK